MDAPDPNPYLTQNDFGPAQRHAKWHLDRSSGLEHSCIDVRVKT